MLNSEAPFESQSGSRLVGADDSASGQSVCGLERGWILSFDS